jgi:3-oxoacyl-[acyl-carrier protein] reductase
MAMRKLTGKVALVTGASKGIGAAIAQHLAAEGAAVVVNYSSSRADADRVVSVIQAQDGKAVAIQASLASPTDIQRLFAETKKAFGALDILVNNAGIYEFTPLEDITPEHFHKHFDLNVLGLLLAIQQAVKYFGPAGGSIVNISSIVSTGAFPNAAVYAATKAAVDALTRCLAKELGPRKIRINCVNPGMIETEGTRDLVKTDIRKQYEAQAALGRIGRPEDIAPAVVFLAGPDSAFLTGETLFITGGTR